MHGLGHPVQRGKLVAQVRRDHEVPVVPRQLPRGPLGLPGESITTRPYFVFPRVFWLKSIRSACSRSLDPLGGRLAQRAGPGRCTCRPTSAFLSLYTIYSNCHNIAATDPAEFVRSGNDLVLRRISSPELLLQPRRCNVTHPRFLAICLVASLLHANFFLQAVCRSEAA